MRRLLASACAPTALAAALLAACANPLPPTGGSEDRTAPRLIRASPDTNAVNVTSGTVRLVFSEPVDEATIARSLTVTPDLDAAPAIAWSRRRREATIRLGPLRPNTTYVLTFDTNLRDERGVALGTPFVYAFSTGPRLSRGVVSGRVVDAASGQARGGVDVFGYLAHDPAADTLPARPDVRTQTGADGAFRLAYLSAAPLYVVAVEDRNRNRRADPLEPFAAPPAPRIRPAENAAGVDSSLVWRLSVLDTARARVERVRSFAATRHAVRFSRPVVVRTVEGWTVRDSAGAVPVLAVWRDPADARQVVFVTPGGPARPLTVTPGAVLDSLGQVARATPQRFTPSAAADTLGLRLRGFSPARVAPDSDGRARPRVDFSRMPADAPPLAVTDTSGRPQPFELARVDDGAGYWIGTALPAVVRVTVGDSTYAQRFDPLDERTLGGLSGVAARPSGDPSPVVVEALAEGGRVYRTTAAPDGTFAFVRLPAGPYRLRAILDRDRDGRWTPGRLAPYRAAEPLLRLDAPQAVRARWDAALPDTLRF